MDFRVGVELTRRPVGGYAAVVTKTPLVTLVDYGGGNLRSVVRALTHVGARVRVSADPAVVAQSDRVVLPGQGAFDSCMGALTERGLVDAIQSHLDQERPFLGICLGLQILFERSEEAQIHQGLGVFRGEVLRFQTTSTRKVPHMGWNTATAQTPMRCLPPSETASWFYFVHSYYLPESVRTLNEDAHCAISDYEECFVSAIERDHIFACQFHPEKSQAAGLGLLERFIQ